MSTAIVRIRSSFLLLFQIVHTDRRQSRFLAATSTSIIAAHNRFLTTIRGILLKPRFLVVIVTVLTLCLIDIHHKKTLDGVNQHLPEHINRVGGKV